MPARDEFQDHDVVDLLIRLTHLPSERYNHLKDDGCPKSNEDIVKAVALISTP